MEAVTHLDNELKNLLIEIGDDGKGEAWHRAWCGVAGQAWCSAPEAIARAFQGDPDLAEAVLKRFEVVDLRIKVDLVNDLDKIRNLARNPDIDDAEIERLRKVLSKQGFSVYMWDNEWLCERKDESRDPYGPFPNRIAAMVYAGNRIEPPSLEERATPGPRP